MLAKITRGNQLTIPRDIVEKAHLNASSPYVDVHYINGVIYLKPVIVEERMPPEQLEKFQNWALQKEKGDQTFETFEEGIRHLEKRRKRK